MKCLKCGHITDDQTFIVDYRWDEEEDDEVSVCVCPKCKNPDDEDFIDET